MTSAPKLFFSAALILAVAEADNRLANLINRHKTAPRPHRFNLESVMPPSLEDNEYWRPAEHEYEPPEHDPKYHEEMPEGPVYTQHKMPISEKAHPAEQQHRTDAKPMSNEAPTNYFFEYPTPPKHHIKGEHFAVMEERKPRHVQRFELKIVGQDQPHEEIEDAQMRAALQGELRKRFLAPHHERRPIFQHSKISDVKDQTIRSLGVTEVTETVYDDLSVDRVHRMQETDEFEDTSIGFLPDDDGILRTFIDRYTTMLVHDSIYVEQMPPQIQVHRPPVSLMEELVMGSLKHDPRESVHHFVSNDEDDNEAKDDKSIDEKAKEDKKKDDKLKLADEKDEDEGLIYYHHPHYFSPMQEMFIGGHLEPRFEDEEDFERRERRDIPELPLHAQREEFEHTRRIEPSAAQLLNQPHDTYDIDKYYHVQQHHGFPIDEGYHHERSYYGRNSQENGAAFGDDDVKDGVSHMGDTLGMHFRLPEELQIREREVESAHRHRHHATTRYEPDFQIAHEMREHAMDEAAAQWHEEPHLDSGDLDSHHHREGYFARHDLLHDHEIEGLPVHDRYGERVIDHDPYNHEFVHGTNYEIFQEKPAPVMEHNPHAYGPQHAQPDHSGDVKKIPAPQESVKAEATSASEPKVQEDPKKVEKPTKIPKLNLHAAEYLN